VFIGVELGHIDVDEAHVGVLERRLGGGGEVAIARADADHQVGVAGDQVRPQRAGDADRAQVERVIVGQRALARLRLPDGDARLLDELAQHSRRVAVVHAAAGDDQRTLALPDPLRRLAQRGEVGAVARDVPDALAEERPRIVEGHRLHVLGQGQGHRAGVGGRSQHTHRFRQGGEQLLRAGDAIPVARDRLEAVVDRNVLRVLPLKLLQHGGRRALGEDVAGQQQHGDAVDRRRRRAGDHVGRAGADGRSADEGLQAIFHLGVGDGGVDHCLLVARLVVAEGPRCLLQRLADAGDVAVAEDAPTAGEEGVFDAVAFNILVL